MYERREALLGPCPRFPAFPHLLGARPRASVERLGQRGSLRSLVFWYRWEPVRGWPGSTWLCPRHTVAPVPCGGAWDSGPTRAGPGTVA